MKKLTTMFITVAVLSTLLIGCSSKTNTLQPVITNQQTVQAKSYTQPEEAKDPDYVYAVGIYPQYMASSVAKVKEFMTNNVKDEVASYKFGGYTSPDDAELQVKFFGVKNKKLFTTQIIMDMKKILGSEAGGGNLYDADGNKVKIGK